MGNGFTEPNEDVVLSSAEEAKLKKIRKKDAKALAIIQQGVHDSIFSRIALSVLLSMLGVF